MVYPEEQGWESPTAGVLGVLEEVVAVIQRGEGPPIPLPQSQPERKDEQHT